MLVALPVAPQGRRHPRRPHRRDQRFPAQLARSITWDRVKRWPPTRVHHRHRRPGLLLRPHAALATRQQREHQRVLRQYCPKDTTSARFTQADLDAIALELNERPRQTLGFKTPSQALAEVLR